MEHNKLESTKTAIARWQRAGGRRCTTCKEPVIFVRNVDTGNAMIVDAKPNWTKGNIFITGGVQGHPEMRGKIWSGEHKGLLEDNLASGVPFHTDHHATCPHVDQHRRPKDAAA